MSYTIRLQAATKPELKAKVRLAMELTAAEQPQHAHDKEAAIGAAHAYIDLLTDDEAQDVYVVMQGSLFPKQSADSHNMFFTHAGVTVGAAHAPRNGMRRGDIPPVDAIEPSRRPSGGAAALADALKDGEGLT